VFLGYGPDKLDNVLMRCYIRVMKRKDLHLPAVAESQDRGDPLTGLIDALLAMRNPGELRALLEDLCTPAELEAIADRWRVIPLLLEGVAYREIHDRTGVSVTTTGRVARCLELGAGGYRLAAERVLGAPIDRSDRNL
jgi:TrpR-related protein YerC/YecD